MGGGTDGEEEPSPVENPRDPPPERERPPDERERDERESPPPSSSSKSSSSTSSSSLRELVRLERDEVPREEPSSRSFEREEVLDLDVLLRDICARTGSAATSTAMHKAKMLDQSPVLKRDRLIDPTLR
jgi:hypothetical protein